MNKRILSFLLIAFCLFASAQNQSSYSLKDLKGFDKEAAWKEALKRSNKPAEQKEVYQSLLKQYVLSQRSGTQVLGSTQPFGYSQNGNKTIINLTPSNAYCQNLDFGDLNYSNWTGGIYGNSAGQLWTTFTPAWTNGIFTYGNNTPQQPAVSWGAGTPKQNRHTIMTIPPTVNNPPANCIGWDSIAVNPTHVSDIPFVPAWASGVTCRLGNANNDYETERLVYTMNVGPNNSQLTYYYAVVLYDGTHGLGEQPFFKVTMKDQNGNPIPGCGQYQIDASNVATDTSFKRASMYSGGTWTDGYLAGGALNTAWWYYVYYKKWTTVGVDLSAYMGQNVTIEFQTGDCIYGGHWGYAYIDANCGPTQIPVNMCAGNTVQQLLGPPGYITYQWYGPNSQTNAIAGPNGTNDTLFINNGNVGDTYYLTAISANGCTTYVQATLQFSSVSVQLTSSTPSCPGGNSGTASVVPIGSPGPYSYTWQNSVGTTVGTSNPCTGLSPGTYSVNVSAPNCGSFDTVVTVGIAPPIMMSTTKNFCGSAAYLTTPAGATNIQWYNTVPAPIPGPQGNNDTLLVTNASNGQVYTVVYTNQGCLDSLRITLTQVAGGILGHSNIQNTCIGGSNGNAVVTLSTTQPSPYNYTMNGPGLNQTYTGVTQTSFTLSNLAYGTYTITAFDGMCFYGDVFKIDTISIPVYLTVAPKTICNGDSVFINYQFGGAAPTQCQAGSGTCLNPQSLFVGPANSANSTTAYPTPFGNWYTKMKAQYIYTQAELTAAGISAGKINSIAFNCTQINGAVAYPSFNVSIGCTAQTTYSAIPSQNDIILGLTPVYSAAVYNVVLGANTFNFSQPYEWDGISNLVVEICFEFPGTSNWTFNCVVDLTTSPNYASLTVVTDTDPICAGYVPGGFYWAQSDQSRPTATFGWCSSVATPNMYTYNLSPTTGLVGTINPPTATVLQPAATTTYTFTTTSVVGNCSKKDTFTIFVNKPFNILMPPPATFCSNSPSTTLTATFTDVNTGAPVQQQATWTGNGISNNNGLGSATFNPATAGVGTHTLILTAGTQCVLQDTVVFIVNQWQSAQLNPIGPFCVYDPAVQIQAASSGGVWTGPVNPQGVFNPTSAGVTSNLTPPYHFIKYVVNAGTPCPDSSSIQVQVFAKPLVDFTTDTTEGCEPSVPIYFTSNVTPPGGTYNWNFGATSGTSTSANPTFMYSIPGTYSPKLTYTDPNGCTDFVTKGGLITVHPAPNASFYANPGNTTILDPHVNFINTSTGANNNWLWDIAGLMTTTVKNPDYIFDNPGLYQVSLWVVNQFGCKDSVIQFVKVDPENAIYVPGGFTPNFDGKNDVFKAQGFGIFEKDSFKMTVYDRWGSKLFEASDINEGWDGTKNGEVVQEDVYVWQIYYKDITGKQHIKSGAVSLIK